MFRRILFISAALLLFTLLVREGIEQYQKMNKISVVLLTVESLRQDMVRVEITPNLLKAAETGYRSMNHRAVNGRTGVNMISLLTGLSPFNAGVYTRVQSVGQSLNLPLQILGERGYLVAGLQRFMTMDLYRNLGIDISDVGSNPMFWLTQRGQDGEPFFLWEHYVHTHRSYRPGSGYGGGIEAIHALQQANIQGFDDWFAGFWEFFNKSGLSSRCVLIVTADHGDEHGESGNVGHAPTDGGGQLHEESVRVPFFIWLPEKLQRKNYPKEFLNSSHQDVIVTLLTLLDIPVPEILEGRNLFDSSPAPRWREGEKADSILYYKAGIVDNGLAGQLEVHP